MHLRLLKVVIMLGFAALTWSGTVAQTQTHDGFELVKDQDNIQVYERWVTFPKSEPAVTAREVKSEFYVKADMGDVIALMRDESQILKWQSHVSEYKIYALSDSVWREYSYRDIPWPVSDQDHYLEYRIEDARENGSILIRFETVNDDRLAPVRDNVSRMTLSGSWYFQSLSPGKIKATYRILSMPGNLPRFITDPVIRNNLMTTVRSYIDILESGYSAP